MKFTVPQDELSAAIALTTRATTTRGTIPAMAHILIAAAADSVELLGYDGDRAIRTNISATVEQPEAISVPAKLWGELVGKMLRTAIVCEVEDGCLKMTSGKAKYTIKGWPADEFPDIPSGGNGTPLKVTAAELLDALDACLVAIAAPDQFNEMLKAVHMKASGDALELATTDGHRLAVVQAEAGSHVDSLECNIPGQSMATLEGLLKRCDPAELVELYLDDDPVQVAYFKVGRDRLIARVAEGQYPPYEKLMPKQFATTVTLSATGLRKALERVGVLASLKTGIVDLEVEGECIEVRTDATEAGSAYETLKVNISGPPVKLSLNFEYLLDGLKAIAAESVEMFLNLPTSPIVLRPAGAVEPTYMLMPVQKRNV